MIEYEAKDGQKTQMRERRILQDVAGLYSFLPHGPIPLSQTPFSYLNFPAAKDGASRRRRYASDEDENRDGPLPGQLLRGFQFAT